MLLFHDITDLKRSREDALAASQAKSSFLSNMSHEIRTPMNAIFGMTAIGKSSQTIEKKDDAFGKIEGASKHLLAIINDILDMSKIEAGKFELSPVSFEFERMLQKVVDVVSLRVDERRQRFSVNICKDVPRVLIGDDQRLSQVITNLLSNAIKFTPDGGSIHLDSHLVSEENGMCRVQISIEDTGIGITEEQKARLFHSFEQAEAGTMRQYGGTGLGLPISKRIVEMMGGDILVESEPGKGSKFAFTVLLKRGAFDESTYAGSGTQQDEMPDFDDDFSGFTVLLAEDVEITREIVMSMLEPTRLIVECAKNGALALSAFAEAPDKYDMIFMDIQMPEMDGYQATRAIRALDLPQAKAIPIIAMTANVFREDVEKCHDAGMDGHVGKPLDFDKVTALLRQYLRKHA
jgi:CheY-like chemotaxis protein